MGPPDKTRNDWLGYPRRGQPDHRAGPVCAGLIILALIVSGLVALYGMLEWWNVPILIVFGIAVFVLFPQPLAERALGEKLNPGPPTERADIAGSECERL